MKRPDTHATNPHRENRSLIVTEALAQMWNLELTVEAFRPRVKYWAGTCPDICGGHCPNFRLTVGLTGPIADCDCGPLAQQQVDETARRLTRCYNRLDRYARRHGQLPDLTPKARRPEDQS